MNGKVNFSKIQNCNQVWEDMDLCQGGRKCSKCSNVITDFRGMSDWEIAVIHAHSTKKVCGLYDKRIFIPKTKKENKRRLHRILFPGMIGLLINGAEVTAQTISNVPHAQHVSSENQHSKRINGTQNNHIQSNDSIQILRGLLLDSTGEPIVGGNVIIEGTTRGTITEIDGTFSLDVTSDFKTRDIVSLLISYTGYGNKTVVVNKTDFNNEPELNMKAIVIEEDYMIISFGIERESFPKRIWRGFKNIFRKKK